MGDHREKVFTCHRIKRVHVNDEHGELGERSSLSQNSGLQCPLVNMKRPEVEPDLIHLLTVVVWIFGVILKDNTIHHSALRLKQSVNQMQRDIILTAGFTVPQLARVARHVKFDTSSSAPPRRAPGHQRSHRPLPKFELLKILSRFLCSSM